MSLKIWLPLDGDLRNLGCSGYNITSFETPTYTAGKIGQCYQRMNSSTQSTNGINIDDNLVEMLGTQASVAVWVKPLGTHTHYNGTIISSGNWNAKKWAFGVSQDNSQVDVLCGGYNNYISCSVPVNEWTHLVSTFNNGTCKLYKNGIYIGEKTGQAAFVSDATNTCIGRETYASGYFGFNGLINDVRIYDHCLSAAEVKEIAMGLVLHYKLDDITNGIIDSSGYGRNGTITGTLTTSSDAPRYNVSTYFDGSSYVSTAAGTMSWYQMDQGTLTCWMKPTANMNSWRGSWGICQDDGTEAKGWAITDYANTFMMTYTNGSSYLTISSGKILPQNEWHHCAATLNDTTLKMYFDGELVKTETINWGTATMPTATRMELGVDFPGTDEKFTGNYSDARFYVTPLLDTDIKLLYNMGMRIDNLGEVHTFEINENSSKNKLTKTGILNNNIIEPYLTLPDGSNWKLILYHYVDNGNNLFTSSNATYCNDFGLYSRLRDINNYTYGGKYEFYVIQDDEEFRWTQTSQPTASSITGLATVEGYNNPVNGLAKANQSNTYIGYGAWWGACGCWTKYSTGGKTGIPGFGPHSGDGICEKYLALYTRIEKNNASFENSSVNATEFIEI